MKTILIAIVLFSTMCFGQQNTENKTQKLTAETYIKSVENLTLEGAFELANRANKSASLLNKKIAIAVLDFFGSIILLTRQDGVGPHNTEAARRKAYTALSTKTPTLSLARNAAVNADTKNLNTLPELLLLGGGLPIWHKGNVIGSIGIAGGGSPENDDLIAKSATVTEFESTTTK